MSGLGCIDGVIIAPYLFKSTVDSSRSSSRKQKTGYCLPSSLNRSSFTVRLIFCRQALMHPILVVFGQPINVQSNAYHCKMKNTS